MLDLRSVHCVLPDGRTVLNDISLVAEDRTITALVGRSGSGGATLVRALAGALVSHSRLRGTATLDGRRMDGATPEELATSTLWISDTALPGGTVAAMLRDLLGDLSAAEDLGLADDLGRQLTSLPIDLRLRLHCATLMAQPVDAPPPLILVDRVLGAADAATRENFCWLLGELARAGSTVVWAEHDLDAVWEHADQVVELVDGSIVWIGSPHEWKPSSLPEPMLLTLARALGMPPQDCRTPAAARETMSRHRIDLPLFPTRAADGSTPTGSGTVIDATAVGLSGPNIDIRSGETLGIVEIGGRPEALARRLIARLPGGDVVPSQLPATLRLGAVARVWERRHHLVTGSVLRGTPTLQPRTLLNDLSPGQFGAFRRALARDVETPLWLSHPQAGLDPRERHTLAEDLRRRAAGTRLVTSRDTEFLVRACHRIIVLRDGAVVGEGSPAAVADLLPVAPMVSRAVGSTRYLRLTDVLESTRKEVLA